MTSEKKIITLGDIVTGRVDIKGDHDVENTITDEVFPCICEGVRLTDAGYKHYESIMDLPVTVSDGWFNVKLNDDQEALIPDLRQFCYEQAGYLEITDFEKWFTEAE